MAKKNVGFSFLSIVETKYIVETSCCRQVLWMNQTLKDIGVMCDEPIPIFYDNTRQINISNNLVMHSRTNHISIKYHFLREKVL
jgi:pyruvate-formate lyase